MDCTRLVGGGEHPLSNCLPLPTGAIISTGLTCFEPGCAKCPVVDGYYAGIPCGCDPPPQGTNLAVWIPCSCLNAAQAGGDSCPVFRAILPDGSPMCVRPNFAAGPVPNVSGGTITCAHVPGGCCSCCSTCAGIDCASYSIRFTNGAALRTDYPTFKFCCNTKAAIITASGELYDYAETIPGGACNGQLLRHFTFGGTIGPLGGLILWTDTQYECGNPNHSTVTAGSTFFPGGGCGLPATLNPLGGTPTPVNGSESVSCFRISQAWTWDGGPGGHHGTWSFEARVTGNAGNCDTPCRGTASGGIPPQTMDLSGANPSILTVPPLGRLL